MRLRPERDERGNVVCVARAQLVDADAPRPDSIATEIEGMPLIPVSSALLFRLVPGDRLKLRDAHGSDRTLRVVAVNEWGAVVTTKRTTHLVDGTAMRFRRTVGVVQGIRPATA